GVHAVRRAHPPRHRGPHVGVSRRRGGAGPAGRALSGGGAGSPAARRAGRRREGRTTQRLDWVPSPGTPGGLAMSMTATFDTSKGTFKVRLLPEHAPITVKNFVELATGHREWTDPRDGQRKAEPLY